MMAQKVLLCLIGLAAGSMVAAGVFAFITLIGVVTRLAARTKTVRHVMLYEDMAVLGGTVGNLLTIFQWKIPAGTWLLCLFGIFAGIYVGCQAIALAEALKVIPVFAKRIQLKVGLSLIILILAIGKGLGALYQLYFYWE